MEAIVYILYSKFLDKYYVGHTTETIEERLRKHLTAHSGFTSKAKDWKIMYLEKYTDKSQAYKREIQIKGWKSKKRIQNLLSKH
ncbi:GIY-YIG nuclease family protein [Mongoliibacter ruber]|uniref:Putative endonuclease n=1 Tax=Mongoliibacter ruber TaxID=1750599 RepID=A0A2T0WLW5_9BACT|nr:GIY-YIG nuclease family protein [Mongoliibacter ruber]PRY87514.1 putative endonuclease [Mongoliibacter ruber]